MNDTAALQARAPQSEEDWQRYYALRWRVLRAPWQAEGPPREDDDAQSIHRMLCSASGDVLAVGRVHQIDPHTAQVRFMAVEAGCERRGHGSRLLRALERTAAAELGVHTVILQARENAVPFYRYHGYEMVEKSFLLFGEIQHYLMRKRLED